MTAIPAATVSDVDLVAVARIDPDAAREIARLGHLMDQGEESNDEFCRLCELLYDVGEKAKAEYLLRRNLTEGEMTHDLYIRLFGTKKQEEFLAAIAAFGAQFNAELTAAKKLDFLRLAYQSAPRIPHTGPYSLLSQPCKITFGYIDLDVIEADITILDPERDASFFDKYLLMMFVNGIWELADPMTD